MFALIPILLGIAGQSTVHLQSPSCEFEFNPTGANDSGTWTDHASRKRVTLKGCTGFEIELGDDPTHPQKVEFVYGGATQYNPRGVSLDYFSKDGKLTARENLLIDSDRPILHKTLTITNRGKETQRILNVILSKFPLGTAKAEGGERGFPLYLNKQIFLSLTHPAGFSHVEGKDVVLRQYPGVKLGPGRAFQSMEAIYGVAKAGEARELFVDYVRSRMCRVIYGQDKPYAILESFGGQETGDFHNNFSVGVSEDYLAQHLDQVEKARTENGAQFDFYSLEFWHDRAGDLTTFNRNNFPNGFGRTRDQILANGMKPALWIDSGGLPDWTVDLNPTVKDCRTHADGTGEFCRACEPLADLYKKAYLTQMSENKVGLAKFDNLGYGGRPPVCNNPSHDHLPGALYSTEAIYNGVIDFFSTLRKANPNIFIMLYWGYRSPWWLQWGDTYFECGAPIEGASPAQYPTPYARDAVTQRLDQAQLTIEDTPWLGKDSLGVWLSDWSWNSNIGKSRWQEGSIMDMARGSLLFQLWTDEHFLTSPERSQVATFIDLMKANQACFEHSRPILGNANNLEPYGYSCSDGKRAFLCIDNACLKDSLVNLSLGPKVGLPAGKKWDVYRWYPEPAQTNSSILLRPYEVTLLEVVPAGEAPSLGRTFTPENAGKAFAEPSVQLQAAVKPILEHAVASRWMVLKPTSATARTAKLTVKSDGSVLASGVNPPSDTYTVFAQTDAKRITGVMLEALPDPSLPANGPGRVYNGNFALSSLRLQVHAPSLGQVKFKSATADFFQTSFGGMPPNGIIDDDPKTRWSIHPRVGMAHAVVLELEHPIDCPEGASLELTLEHSDPEHNLGRFRLSLTGDANPTLPDAYRVLGMTVSFTTPKTQTGGLLFFVGGNQDNPPQLTLDGKHLQLTSVWNRDANWACPWTAWRIELEPAEMARKGEIVVKGGLGAKWSLYFLPK